MMCESFAKKKEAQPESTECSAWTSSRFINQQWLWRGTTDQKVMRQAIAAGPLSKALNPQLLSMYK